MDDYSIPLSVPSLKGNEWKYVKDCLDTEWVSSAGKYVKLFEEKVADYTGVKYAVACSNGTSALQVSLKLAGVEPEDEVIVPTLSFIASINAIAYNGAKPVFMDADKYFNIDIDKTIEFINNKTFYKNGYTFNKNTGCRITAIVPVHVWGNVCQLYELSSVCEKKNITIVEDACESLGSFYIKDKSYRRHTGTIGKFGCLSFNGNKIITTGGGGMILTNDKNLAEKALYLTTQAKNDPIRYVHNEIGYNFRLNNIQAAIGVAQLEQLPNILKIKRKIRNLYNKELTNINGVNLAGLPDYADNNCWLNILQADGHSEQSSIKTIMKRLEKKNIQTRPVWKLNHLQKPYLGSQTYKINKAQQLVNNSLCLPSSTNISKKDIKNICSILIK
jgi:perosamine synthetase